MYMSPFQNSRSAFLGSRRPVMQQHIFRPQPAFFQPQPRNTMSLGASPLNPQPTQFGQLKGSSGPTPPSLEEVLSQRGFEMPERPTGIAHQAMVGYEDPVTGKMMSGGAHDASHARLLGDFYGQNPEALELAKQYNTDPTQFGGKPAPTRSLQQPIEMIQRPGGSVNSVSPPADLESARRQPDYGQQVQEMQSMMREMMQMISALSNRGGFGGGYGGGFGGYSPRQQMMFGGIGSIPMSRGMFY